MHFSNLIIAVASMASAAIAQTTNPNSITNIGITQKELVAGQKYTVQWDHPAGNKVTVTLRNGNPNALNTGVAVCTSVANTGSCEFTVPADWQNGDQNTVEICQDGTQACNYSPMFDTSGGNGKASPTGTDAASATDNATESGSLIHRPTVAETVTGTATPTTLNTKSSYGTETALPTETEAAASSTTSAPKSKSTGSTANAPSPNEGSVARSSSLAMALCVFAAVVYLN